MKKIAAQLICLALSTAAYLSGCAKNEEFTRKSFRAESEEITNVFIDVRDRQIEVMLSDDNYIHIDYFENGKEYYDITVSDNHALFMTAQNNKELADYIGGKSAVDRRKILLQLPKGSISTLSLSTTNESITLAALTINGDISLSSKGGDIFFDKLYAGKSISLRAKNSNISGTLIGNYNDYAISCNVKKGSSNLPSNKENGTKRLTVTNNNGNIDIQWYNPYLLFQDVPALAQSNHGF